MEAIKSYLNQHTDYTSDLFHYQRRKASTVAIGGIPLGGNNPIRVQSMAINDTMNTTAIVEEIKGLADAGCEYARVTAPSKKEAENLKNIKAALRQDGYDIPIVADIHFTPNAAEIAAGLVEKVRINPGNFADKKKFEEKNYTAESYQAEIERIRKKFIPLLEKCKANGTALRIGTNHGSLSDRIMSYYGDTPMGMVESAMEFLRIAVEFSFEDIVLSMKASNPKVMIQAYRLLVAKMQEEGMNFPLHLGVTEAGDGDDGRIKSAIGIGTLLEDGLGDTIRVSLTEDAIYEIPVAEKLVAFYPNNEQTPLPFESEKEVLAALYQPFEVTERPTKAVEGIGGDQEAIVVADMQHYDEVSLLNLMNIGYRYSVPLDKWETDAQAADFIYVGKMPEKIKVPPSLGVIVDAEHYVPNQVENTYPLFQLKNYTEEDHFPQMHSELNFIAAEATEADFQKLLSLQEQGVPFVVLLSTPHQDYYRRLRAFCLKLQAENIDAPIVLRNHYSMAEDEERMLLKASVDFGSLLTDGFGNGIWISTKEKPQQKELAKISRKHNKWAFGILQASNVRISQTEYISCPSCGRTLFDLQETTAMIRARTNHLKGVKIAVMGCIVNGPGEMADAHYGYVGSGPGKITLYKGKEVVKRNIESAYALDELIDLIDSDGKWVTDANTKKQKN